MTDSEDVQTGSVVGEFNIEKNQNSLHDVVQTVLLAVRIIDVVSAGAHKQKQPLTHTHCDADRVLSWNMILEYFALS